MLLFLLIIITVAIGWLVKVYNTLQSSMQSIREGFSNLQAGLKKRQQLSGQIIEIASGYLEHEQITQLKVAQANNTQQMMAMAQSFPQLKADATYQKLMGQLERLENEILERREGYNNRVRRFNSYRNSFPAVLVAQKLSFGTVEYFNSDDEKFDAQAQSFARDDTEGLQKIIGSSAQAVKSASEHAARAAKEGVSQLKQQYDDKPDVTDLQQDVSVKNEASQDTEQPTVPPQ